MPDPITEINPTTALAADRFSTLSGTGYDVSYAAMTLRRAPGRTNTPEGTANLRCDGEIVDLLVSPRIAIGERCHLIIGLQVDGVPFTSRYTMPVNYIEILDREAGE